MNKVIKIDEAKYERISIALLRKASQTAQEKGITQQMIEDRTGFKQSNISRMLCGKYHPQLDNFIRLCEACEFDWYSEIIK